MQSEARALGTLRDHPDLRLGISSARPERAERIARDMVQQGVQALVSWGIAGALVPELPSGALLLPGAVDLVASAWPEVTVALYHSGAYGKAHKFHPVRFRDLNSADGYER